MLKVHVCTHRWCRSHDKTDFGIQDRREKIMPELEIRSLCYTQRTFVLLPYWCYSPVWV
jgi:hypothetical protein